MVHSDQVNVEPLSLEENESVPLGLKPPVTEPVHNEFPPTFTAAQDTDTAGEAFEMLIPKGEEFEAELLESPGYFAVIEADPAVDGL